MMNRIAGDDEMSENSYLKKVSELIARIEESQGEAIQEGARVIAETIAAGRVCHMPLHSPGDGPVSSLRELRWFSSVSRPSFGVVQCYGSGWGTGIAVD